MKLTLKKVELFCNSEKTIRLHDENDNIKILQALLNKFRHKKLYRTLSEDGDFGRLTENAVRKFQDGRMLDSDGVVGNTTKLWLFLSYKNNYMLGTIYQLPLDNGSNISVYGQWREEYGEIALGGRGECSSFGGEFDSGDNMYGQAYISSARTPKKLYIKHKNLVDMGILRENIKDIDKFPYVPLFKTGRYVKASTSWTLNTGGFYCALYGKSFGKYDENNPRVFVYNVRTKQSCIVMRTDHGPHPKTKREIDLSKGAMNSIGLKTDDICVYGWVPDDSELGYKGRLLHHL